MMIVALILTATPITLEEVRVASRQNLDAVRAELALTRAGLDRAEARSVIFPQVDLNAGATGSFLGQQQRFVTPFNPTPTDIPPLSQANFQLGLSVQQLLYDGGRWWNQLARTGALEEAAKGQLEEQRAASELEAVRRFYELLRAQLALDVLEASVKRSADLLERAKGLFEAGRAQKRDVLDAEVNLGNDRISVIRQRQAIASARASLLQWLGQPPRDVEAVAPTGFGTGARSVLPPEAVLSLAKRRRALFAVLDAQGRGARLAVEVAKADYFPRLAVSAAYGRSAPAAAIFVDPTRQHALTLGANLSWDLFSGFATDSQVSRAQTQLTELERQQQQSLVELEGEVTRATVAFGAQVEISAIASKNRALADESFSAEEQRFAAGATTSLSVRDAQTRALSAQLTQLQTHVDVEIAKAALERLAGGPLVTQETP